jgi:hypothetical protein
MAAGSGAALSTRHAFQLFIRPRLRRLRAADPLHRAWVDATRSCAPLRAGVLRAARIWPSISADIRGRPRAIANPQPERGGIPRMLAQCDAIGGSTNHQLARRPSYSCLHLFLLTRFSAGSRPTPEVRPGVLDVASKHYRIRDRFGTQPPNGRPTHDEQPLLDPHGRLALLFDGLTARQRLDLT